MSQYYKENKNQYFNRRKWFYDIKAKLKCERCGFMTSNKVCKACILLESLKKDKAKI